MFNRLPGAMLPLGHKHQCQKGFNCCPVVSQHTSAKCRLVTAMFNPAPLVAKLPCGIPDSEGIDQMDERSSFG
jgi:hypothetical protein